jgi:hypothetical protein
MTIVMMFVAVISLLGVGLLAQSKLDLQVTSAVRSYDMMFNLGDGGSFIAFNEIKNQNSMMTYDGSVKTMYVVKEKQEKEAGEYDAMVKLCGVEMDPDSIPGWEPGTYFNELWLAEGQGRRSQDLFGAGTGTPVSVVTIAASKLKRKD